MKCTDSNKVCVSGQCIIEEPKPLPIGVTYTCVDNDANNADRIYVASFINKPKKSMNKELTKTISKLVRKDLNVNKKSITAQELNTFLLLRADLDESLEQLDIFNNLDKGNVFSSFQSYYKQNEKNLISTLKSDLELKETSKIISDFLKIIDKSYVGDFSIKMNYIKPTS